MVDSNGAAFHDVFNPDYSPMLKRPLYDPLFRQSGL